MQEQDQGQKTTSELQRWLGLLGFAKVEDSMHEEDFPFEYIVFDEGQRRVIKIRCPNGHQDDLQVVSFTNGCGVSIQFSQGVALRIPARQSKDGKWGIHVDVPRR